MFTNKRKGQAYIEIMVVVAVLLIIALLVIPRYQNLRRDAYRAQIANDSKLVETYAMEDYFCNGNMPIGSQAVDSSGLKELVDSKRSYLKGEIISSADIDTIGGEKYLLDKEDILKHVNTKLKGDFIYTNKGVIYIDNAKGSSSTEKRVDQTDLIREIENKIERLVTTENKDEGYELMDNIPKEIDKVIDKRGQDRLTKDYDDALEEFLSKFLGKIKQVSIGFHHSAAITENGDLYTWGSWTYGKLGHGDRENQLEPKKVEGLSNVKQVDLGRDHSAAITEDGSLYTWGSGTHDKLGHGASTSIPKKVEGLSNVKQVSLGINHSAAITEDGDLYTWGSGTYGRLGHGDTKYKKEPTKVISISNVKQVALGDIYSAAITENGDLYTWGGVYRGTPGYSYTTHRYTPTKIESISNVKQVALGEHYSAAVTEDGSLYTWGERNDYGQLGHGDEIDKSIPTKVKDLSNVKQVVLGADHSAAITEDGSLYTWGNGSDGKLGHGDTDNKNIPTKVKGISNVKQVSLGAWHSAAITEDGNLYTWGYGYDGQLGHGDKEDRLTPTKAERISNIK